MKVHQTLADTRAGTFDTVAKADQAIRRLVAAGFTEEHLTVVCPAKFKEECMCAVPGSGTAKVSAGEAMAKGGVVGAALGGLALTGAVLTGGLSLPAAALLIGGSAFAGGFSNLIVSKGYEVEAPDHVKHALQAGRIVVGVDAHGANAAGRLAEAQRILDAAGAEQPRP